jgi:hypothetical protein
MNEHAVDEKQPYKKPALTEYGHVRQLTLQASKSNSDNSADTGK